MVAHVSYCVVAHMLQYSLKHVKLVGKTYRGLFLATVSCNVVCDVVIAFGLVYTLWRKHTAIRRTNNVLNILAMYTINCGILNLVISIPGIVLV
ncbi:hypothetical protein EI94DRAFT_1733138 [Lactarius quietus]|nr:hypothetical protein EI94DRAFT_1733138 [Lactarius quietus]